MKLAQQASQWERIEWLSGVVDVELSELQYHLATADEPQALPTPPPGFPPMKPLDPEERKAWYRSQIAIAEGWLEELKGLK